MISRIIISSIAILLSIFMAMNYVFIDYSNQEAIQELAAWSRARGVHEDIFVFYRVLNGVTALGLALAAVSAWFYCKEAFKLVLVFTLGYFFWDIMTYIPMARIANEGFSFEQWIFYAFLVIYMLLSLAYFPKKQ